MKKLLFAKNYLSPVSYNQIVYPSGARGVTVSVWQIIYWCAEIEKKNPPEQDERPR